MKPTNIFAAALTAAGFLFAPVATAQQDQSTPAIAAEDVTDAQLESFVDAMTAIDGVRQEYMPQIESAENEDERQSLAQEADNAARAAVEDTDGITADEYVAIGQAAQENQELATRINERFTEQREN